MYLGNDCALNEDSKASTRERERESDRERGRQSESCLLNY